MSEFSKSIAEARAQHEAAVQAAADTVALADKSDPWARQRALWLLRTPVVPCDLEEGCGNQGRNRQVYPRQMHDAAMAIVTRRLQEIAADIANNRRLPFRVTVNGKEI